MLHSPVPLKKAQDISHSEIIQDSIEDIKSQSSQLADEVAAVEVDDEEADEDGQDDEDDEETEEVQENGEVVTVKATKGQFFR